MVERVLGTVLATRTCVRACAFIQCGFTLCYRPALRHSDNQLDESPIIDDTYRMDG